MKKITQGIKQRYRSFFSDPASIVSTITAFVFLLGSFIVNYFANQYSFVSKSNSVTDILLDNLPVINMDDAFIASTFIFTAIVFFLLTIHPQKISFVIKTVALFIITRSLFISLTHIGPSPLDTLETPSKIIRAFSSGADLFFSGHTGMPFLFALMYWYNKKLRALFLIGSILAAMGVLLGHIHYSIDVASAFFITYGIYIIAGKVFRKDFDKFNRTHL